MQWPEPPLHLHPHLAPFHSHLHPSISSPASLGPRLIFCFLQLAQLDNWTYMARKQNWTKNFLEWFVGIVWYYIVLWVERCDGNERLSINKSVNKRLIQDMCITDSSIGEISIRFRLQDRAPWTRKGCGSCPVLPNPGQRDWPSTAPFFSLCNNSLCCRWAMGF